MEGIIVWEKLGIWLLWISSLGVHPLTERRRTEGIISNYEYFAREL
uniref:Uncharacterized protein n=1 Tax=Lepeophtheirus salmonis TaxID=72036 RepID=A0A0K2VE14_LEPSM